MRILYLTPTLAQGGAERLLVDLTTHLSAADQHIAVIYPPSLYPFFFKDQVQVQVTYLDKPLGKLGRFMLAWRYGQLVHRFKPDIVVGWDWFAMDFVRYFHRLDRRKIVLVPHSLMKDQTRIATEIKLANFSHAIACGSDALYQQFVKHVPTTQPKLTLIRNGYDEDRFFPADRHRARQQLNIPEDVVLGVCVGRFDPVKNHAGLLDAIAYLIQQNRWQPNFRLLCIGSITEQNTYDTLVKRLQTENLAPYVHILPPIEHIQTYYHAMDFLILPSHQESFGNVVIEAAACERPAGVSLTANQTGMVEHGVSGWGLDIQNAEAFAAGLASIYTLPSDQRDQIGRVAYQRVLDGYLIRDMTHQFQQLFEGLCT